MSAGIRSGVNCTRLKLRSSALADGADQQRLAQARDAFQQRVAAGQQARQHAAHDLGLADDDAHDFGFDGARGLDEAIRGRLRARWGGGRGRNVGWKYGHLWSSDAEVVLDQVAQAERDGARVVVLRGLAASVGGRDGLGAGVGRAVAGLAEVLVVAELVGTERHARLQLVRGGRSCRGPRRRRAAFWPALPVP